jgi:hypothetical protein
MSTLTIEKPGITTVRARVTVPSIERALELCGKNASVVFPIETDPFSVSKGAAGLIETLPAGASERHARVAA